MSCRDLCTNIFSRDTLQTDLRDDSCIEIATLPSLANFFNVKDFKIDLSRYNLRHKCIIVYDSVGNKVSILSAGERMSSLEDCVIIDQGEIAKRECYPVFRQLDRDTIRELFRFLEILDESREGLLNPYPRELIWCVEDKRIFFIPPHSFVPLDSLDTIASTDLSKAKSLDGRDDIMMSNEVLKIRLRDVTLSIKGPFRNTRCVDLGVKIICVADDILLYYERDNTLILKEVHLDELSISFNIEFNRVFWSHPLGYAISNIDRGEFLSIKSWWFSLSGVYHVISLSSYPFINAEIDSGGRVVIRELGGHKALGVSIGYSIHETAPWVLSQRLLDPVKLDFGSKVMGFGLNIHPSYILIQDLWLERSEKLYLMLVNYLDKDSGVVLRISRPIDRSYISFKKDLWEELIPLQNILRFSMPAHSMSIVRLERVSGKRGLTIRGLSRP